MAPPTFVRFLSYPAFLFRELLAALYVRMAQHAPRTNLLIGFAHDHITSRIALFGAYEHHLIQALLGVIGKNCPPDQDIIIDVGANIGNHTVAFAADAKKVIAFEPNKILFKVLHANCEINGRSNTVLHNIGLSDVNSCLEYRDGSVFNAGEGSFITYGVPASQPDHCSSNVLPVKCGDDVLDPMDCPRISLIKIDTEGHEHAVIGGLKGTLTKNRPLVAFESRERPQLDKCMRALNEYGYEYFYIFDYPYRDVPRLFRVIVRLFSFAKPSWTSIKPASTRRADFPLICCSKKPLKI
jgi:FkbM family methyltransferase